MADPLSIVASVTGILAFAATTARGLTTLVQDIHDAPEDILSVGRDVQTLAAVLATAHDTCVRHDIGVEDKDLAASLREYAEMCQDAMHGLRTLLKPLAAGAEGGRRSPMRFVLGWTMRKGEVRALRGRLNEGKASLTLALSALNGVLEGKGQEDIRADISKVYVQMMSEFRNLDAGRRIKRRVEDDLASVAASRGRRPSISATTDANFAMKRFLGPAGTSQGAGAQSPDAIAAPSDRAFPSPWSHDPSAILEAVRSQNRQVIETLLIHGVSLSPRNAQGFTVLHYCAIADDADTAALLLDHGADVNAKDWELRSPFRLALASEALGAASLLAKRGCVLGDLSSSLIRLAARTEQVPGIKTLLQTLAERLNVTDQGPFLLHDAINSNERGALKILLDSGFDPMKTDQDGLSPLHLGLRTLKPPMMKLLLEHGADVHEQLPRSVFDRIGVPESWHMRVLSQSEVAYTPLVLAARYMRNQAMMVFLLDNGADPNWTSGPGQGTVLGGVCAHEYIGQSKTLVARGANPNHVAGDGRPPIHWAAICQNNELMACMLERGGDFDYQRTQDGSTPLSIAASKGNVAMVKMLLTAGANPSRRNKSGMSPLDLARSGGKREVVSMLEEALGSR